MKKVSILTILFTLIAGFTIAAEVNVFNARHYKADAELYGKFTAATGIKVNSIVNILTFFIVISFLRTIENENYSHC